MKSHELLESYYLRSKLRSRIGEFVAHYNHKRYHESLNNLTPADMYYGRGQTILDQREKIKLETLAMRKQMHYDRRANQLI